MDFIFGSKTEFACCKGGNRSFGRESCLTTNLSKFTKCRKLSTNGKKACAPARSCQCTKWRYVVLKKSAGKVRKASEKGGQYLEGLITLARWTSRDPFLSLPIRETDSKIPNVDQVCSHTESSHHDHVIKSL